MNIARKGCFVSALLTTGCDDLTKKSGNFHDFFPRSPPAMHFKMKGNSSPFAHCSLQILLELFDQFFMGGVDFGVGQGSLCISVGEGVGQALLAGRNVLAPEYVEQLELFQVGRPDFLDYSHDGFM